VTCENYLSEFDAILRDNVVFSVIRHEAIVPVVHISQSGGDGSVQICAPLDKVCLILVAF